MAIFTVTNGHRVLTVSAACRTCARRVAVEYIQLTEPAAEWRDPELTRIALVRPDERKTQGVLTDSKDGPIVSAPDPTR